MNINENTPFFVSFILTLPIGISIYIFSIKKTNDYNLLKNSNRKTNFYKSLKIKALMIILMSSMLLVYTLNLIIFRK